MELKARHLGYKGFAWLNCGRGKGKEWTYHSDTEDLKIISRGYSDGAGEECHIATIGRVFLVWLGFFGRKSGHPWHNGEKKKIEYRTEGRRISTDVEGKIKFGSRGRCSARARTVAARFRSHKTAIGKTKKGCKLDLNLGEKKKTGRPSLDGLGNPERHCARKGERRKARPAGPRRTEKREKGNSKKHVSINRRGREVLFRLRQIKSLKKKEF